MARMGSKHGGREGLDPGNGGGGERRAKDLVCFCAICDG